MACYDDYKLQEPPDNSDIVEHFFEEYADDIERAYTARLMDEVSVYRSILAGKIGGDMTIREFVELAQQYGVIE